MKVKELIKKLQTFSPENDVLINSYEEGFDDISCVENIKVVINPNSYGYSGKYIDCQKWHKDYEEKIVVYIG